MKTFNAPWSREVGFIYTAFLVVCIGVPLIGIKFSPEYPVLKWMLIVLPFILLIIGNTLLVRGYTLDSESLLVHRLGWSQRFDLSSVVSAAVDPAAMNGALRCLGSFHNDRLGDFRAFGNDPKRSVVLRLKDQVIVVTPDRPEDFVSAISTR